MKKVCKYHKTQGQEFTIQEIVPKNMCFEAFSVAYPFALSMLYGADNNVSFCSGLPEQQASADKEFIFQCPSSKNKVIFKMERKEKLPVVVKRMKNFIETIFKKVFFPVDKVQLEYDISMKVIGVEGQCPQKHKVGDEFFFNTKDTNILCPASFNSIHTFIQMIYDGVKMPWAKNNGNFVHCPDHEGMIYKIDKQAGVKNADV